MKIKTNIPHKVSKKLVKAVLKQHYELKRQSKLINQIVEKLTI